MTNSRIVMNNMLDHIPDNLKVILSDIVAKYKLKDDVDAIVLTGSYARGDYSNYSDVDVTVFYEKLISSNSPSYYLNYIENYLISRSEATIREWKEKLSKPQDLVFIYHTVKDSIILFDRQNSFKNLKSSLSDSPWNKIRSKTQFVINQDTKGFVEEVFKLMRGITQNDTSLISYALTGLIIGITSIVAMQFELLVISENHLYGDLQSSLGNSSKWSKLFRESLGISIDNNNTNMIERGKSGLQLYLETLEIVTVDEDVREFVKTPVKMISDLLRE